MTPLSHQTFQTSSVATDRTQCRRSCTCDCCIWWERRSQSVPSWHRLSSHVDCFGHTYTCKM